MEQKQRERNASVLDWYDAVVYALTLVLIIMLFFVRTANVDGTSMVPTLQDRDQIIARSFLYTPKAGDIVVVDGYTNYGAPLVKRVIGVGGDTVDINFDTGDVIVNGQVIDEPYIAEPTQTSYDVQFPVTVPDGHLFLMGDNRNRSKDSRHSDIGFIDERDILGNAFFRILPFSSFGSLR